MKPKKFKKLVQEISEIKANHFQATSRVLFDSDIIEAFDHYKKKHVKRALKELKQSWDI